MGRCMLSKMYEIKSQIDTMCIKHKNGLDYYSYTGSIQLMERMCFYEKGNSEQYRRIEKDG